MSAGRQDRQPADVGRSPLELRNQSRDLIGIYPDHASGKRRFDSGSWHEEEVPNRDQMSLHSVTLLTENLIVLPVQWRLCLLSFLLPVCVLSWTCIPFLESRLSFGMILIRVFYQNSMPSITIPGDRIQLPAYLITTLIYVNSWKMLRGTNPYRKPL